MTVIDTSAIVDYLLGTGAASQVEELLGREDELAAPDLLVFEVLAVLRRDAGRELLAAERAAAAVDDLGDVPIELMPTLTVRDRAWELRHNLTAADALFVALAEELGEPLATKDAALAAAAVRHAGIRVLALGGS